jgi:hypothetical protein
MVRLTSALTGRSVPLVTTKLTCQEALISSVFQHRMALSGTRALWGVVEVANTVYDVTLFTGSLGGREKEVGLLEYADGREQDKFQPVPLAGDALVYSDLNETGAQAPVGRVSSLGPGARTFPGTETTLALGASGQFFALARARDGQHAREVELLRTRSGSVASRFETTADVEAIALDPDHVALMTRSVSTVRVEIRTWRGLLVAAQRVPSSAAQELSLSGRWLVFPNGKAVELLDWRSGRLTVVAHAAGDLVGASVEGDRVAWADSSSKRSFIREIALGP